MSNENNLETKTPQPLYQKGIDDLAQDIFPMEKIIEWFTQYYGKENKSIVCYRLKNKPILAPINVKKFILAQALYRAKLSNIENLDEFFNNERTEASHMQNNAEFFNELSYLTDCLENNILNIILFSPKNTAESLQLCAGMISKLGFDYDDLLQSLKSGEKSPEMKKFLSFIRGAQDDPLSFIEKNYADLFVKYYNFGVTHKKDIGHYFTICAFDEKEIKSVEQFEQDLTSSHFDDLDSVILSSLTDEEKEKLSTIIDDREFYSLEEDQIVEVINNTFNTNHKNIEEILADYETEGLSALYDRLYYYKHKIDYYHIDENLTKEQKDNLTALLTANIDFYELENISEDYSEFFVETINDVFKTHYSTPQETLSDPKLKMFFRYGTIFIQGINNIISYKLSTITPTSNEEYLEQSEQINRLEETNYGIDYFKNSTAYAIYCYPHACTMYRLQPLQISLSTIIHEFNHQMLYGSSYEENVNRFENIGRSVRNKGIGRPTSETINEFLTVRIMQNISIEDLKNYPLPLIEIDGCGYTPAVEHFWNQLIKLEETLKECQLVGTYLPLEQKLGSEKLRAFDFAVRKFYREKITDISKSIDSNFEKTFSEELKNNPLNLTNGETQETTSDSGLTV